MKKVRHRPSRTQRAPRKKEDPALVASLAPTLTHHTATKKAKSPSRTKASTAEPGAVSHENGTHLPITRETFSLIEKGYWLRDAYGLHWRVVNVTFYGNQTVIVQSGHRQEELVFRRDGIKDDTGEGVSLRDGAIALAFRGEAPRIIVHKCPNDRPAFAKGRPVCSWVTAARFSESFSPAA